MRALIVLALCLLLVGTYLLAEALFVWDALLFIAIATLCIVVFSAWHEPGRYRVRAWARQLLPKSATAYLRLCGLALSLLVALAARARPDTTDYALLFAVWMCALLLFLMPLLRPALRQDTLVARLTIAEKWALAALLVAALLVRGIGVGRIPANLGGDEGTQLAAGLDLIAQPMGNPFATGWYSVPTMSFAAYGVAMRLFGATVVGGRMLSVLTGTLTVLTTFCLARTVAGRRVGWVAAAVVAFSSYHIHFSRLASNQIADPLVGTAALWLLWRALACGRDLTTAEATKGRRLWQESDSAGMTDALMGIVGIVTGLGWYAYFGARWVTVLVVLTLLWRGLADRTLLRRHWRGIALLVAGWLVVTLPLWGWYAAHPSALTERYSAVGVFTSGWMQREQVLTGRSGASLFLQQLWRAASAFHLTRDPTFWYRPDRPLVDFVTAALLLLGLFEAVIRVRWPSRALVQLWYWSTVLVAWGLTENPPSSQRGLLLVPPVAIYAGWGIERLLRMLPLPLRVRPHAIAAMLMLIASLNIAFYFGVYTPREVYGNPSAQAATRLADYMRTHPTPICDPGRVMACEGQVYFLGPPWLYWKFGSLAFLLRDYPGVDVAQGELPVTVTPPARFVVVPERAEQIADIRTQWPGGAEVELRGPDDRLLAWIYDWRGAP